MRPSRHARAFACVLLAIASACGPVEVRPAPASAAGAADATHPPASTAAPSPAATAAPTPSSAAAPMPFSKLRVFVASERSDALVVLEGGAEFVEVGRIAVGRFPHNVAVSPDGRWVAAANRLANSISIVDPLEMREVARVRVGRQPHDLIWSPDAATLFVGHERDSYIARVEAGTWKLLPPLVVGVPQHDLAIARSRPTELYFAVTNSQEWDHLRMWDLTTGKVTRITVQDVHDVFFTPDEREIWTTSSGFIEHASDRMVATDPATKAMLTQFHLPGRYPFHTMKRHRDGMFYPPEGTPMLLTDHVGPALLFVDPVQRRIVGETKVGAQPFHTTYDPIRLRLLVTSNAADVVSVIDLATREVVQRVAVPAPHGIVAIGLP